MKPSATVLTALFNRIPRRHSVENIKDINSIIAAYEDLLMSIEAVNQFYEKNIPPFFNDAETVKAAIKKSADNKISKKNKDDFFDEAAVGLKDSLEALIILYADGNRIA